MSRDLSSTTYRRSVDLLEANLGNELVALQPEAGKCFGFNEVATSVWRSLAIPKSFDQLRGELLDEYEVSGEQCTAELSELLEDMVAKGLIERLV